MLARSKACLVTLVDYRMPQMDGYAMLRAAAEDGPELDCHAYVLFTANNDLISPAVAQFLAARHISVMQKPFDIDMLLLTIERARGQLAQRSSPSRQRASA
jgi:CheY-like chemotaxis protein